MRILITGVCGFVGSTIAKPFREMSSDYHIMGIDNFSRARSWINRKPLTRLGVDDRHGDIRSASDVDVLPNVDWVIDTAQRRRQLRRAGQRRALQELCVPRTLEKISQALGLRSQNRSA